MDQNLPPIIFHVDLDCFYAAVERLNHPEYKDISLVVGADPKKGKGRGVVLTSSYEARKFGIRSGMPISQAYHLCPNATFVPPHFDRYFDASHQVMAIIRKYTTSFQQTGSDEGYLDMSEYCADFQDAYPQALQIQQEIFQKTALTVSIGVGPTKSLAKIATDIKKPNGITIIAPDQIANILGPLDVDCIPGIGKKSKDRYYRKGYHIVQDFFNANFQQLRTDFGNMAEWIWGVIYGLNYSPVMSFWDQKLCSEERTFHEDLDDINEIESIILKLYEQVDNNMRQAGTSYRTISLKIRFKGFETYTRAKSFPSLIGDPTIGEQILKDLFKHFCPLRKKVRLVGVKLSNLQEREVQRPADS